MMAIVSMYVHSATKTLYVCLAEDPAVFARIKPEVFGKLKAKYPEIAWRV